MSTLNSSVEFFCGLLIYSSVRVRVKKTAPHTIPDTQTVCVFVGLCAGRIRRVLEARPTTTGSRTMKKRFVSNAVNRSTPLPVRFRLFG